MIIIYLNKKTWHKRNWWQKKVVKTNIQAQNQLMMHILVFSFTSVRILTQVEKMLLHGIVAMHLAIVNMIIFKVNLEGPL